MDLIEDSSSTKVEHFKNETVTSENISDETKPVNAISVDNKTIEVDNIKTNSNGKESNTIILNTNPKEEIVNNKANESNNDTKIEPDKNVSEPHINESTDSTMSSLQISSDTNTTVDHVDNISNIKSSSTLDSDKNSKEHNELENKTDDSDKNIQKVVDSTVDNIIQTVQQSTENDSTVIENNANETEPNQQELNPKTLIDSITSDWTFDMEESSEKTNTKANNQTTSAEIIAMEWDDGNSQTSHDSPDKIVNSKSKSKNDLENNSNNTVVQESTEKEIVCAIESDIDSKKTTETSNANIIILHEITELNLNQTTDTNITIISVDDNPNITENNLSNTNCSYIVETSNDNQSKSTGNIKKSQPVQRKSIENTPRRGGRVGNDKSTNPYVICSKEEIIKATLEQTKVNKIDPPPRGDFLLKNQIIKRFASKILPKSLHADNKSDSGAQRNTQPTTSTPLKQVSDQELLEILEGDTDIDIYNLQKSKESLVNADDSKIMEENLTKVKNEIKLDPETEREIALQQLTEIGGDLSRHKKGKNNNVVVTNVPKTVIIEKTEKDVSGDPFKFEENTKTVGTPSAYGINEVKTYSRKGGNTTLEPSIKEIVVPKELIDLEKESNKKRGRPIQKSKEEPNKTPKVIGKKKIDKKDENEQTDDNKVESTENDSKANLTDDANNVIISKRSRIIKKKIIWDPSQKSPTYLSSTASKNKVMKPKPLITKKKLKSIGNNIEKEVKQTDEESKPVQSEEKQSNENNDETIEENENNVVDKISETEKTSNSDGQIKRKSVSPNTTLKKRKKFKRITEVDRLLMDEGALNMLYSVEQEEEVPLIKKEQRVISLDKFSKEMNKKKKMIMTALNTSPESPAKTLRKKDSATGTPQPVRKKSRDSVHSTHSPPPSPNSMFPPRAEASRIIRRHSSSSSFSSECMSPRRLSTVEQTEKSKTDDDKSWIDGLDSENPSSTSPSKKMKMMKAGAQSRTSRKRGGVPIFVKKSQTNVYIGKTKKSEEKKNDSVEHDKQVTTSSETNIPSVNLEEQKEVKSSKIDTEVTVTKLASSKTSKKDVSPKCPSPTADTYAHTFKTLENVEKRKDGDEKQRSSSRPNAGTYNYKEISLRKYNDLVQIILTPPQSTKIKNTLNIQTMREICDALSTLKKDSSCKAVLITSTGSVFCRGLDYTPLIQQNLEKRKAIAVEMSNSVKEFIRSIIQFPRPIIAGVQGAASGLGVAILPLCDLVFVSDKATFSMNHCKLGCLPEGAASISLPHVTSHAIATELLIAGHTLTAMEALRHGLASRVLWPEGYLQELIPLCETIAAQSSQSMDATKVLIRHALTLKVEAALDHETHLLVQHWISTECQQLLKKAIEQDSW